MVQPQNKCSVYLFSYGYNVTSIETMQQEYAFIIQLDRENPKEITEVQVCLSSS